MKKWSGWGDSNPRYSAWEADVLPLNYTRVVSKPGEGLEFTETFLDFLLGETKKPV